MKNKNPYFETRFKYDKTKNVVWKVVSEYIKKNIDIKNPKIIDLGAGHCFFINNFESTSKYALDRDKHVLKYASNNIYKIVSDVNFLPLKNNSFDVIFLSNLLEHLKKKDIMRLVMHIYEILKHNGYFISITPNFKHCYKSYFDDYTHETILTDESLKDIVMSCGFKIIKLCPKFLPFSAKSKLPKIKLLTKIYLHTPIKPFAGQMLIIAKKP